MVRFCYCGIFVAGEDGKEKTVYCLINLESGAVLKPSTLEELGSTIARLQRENRSVFFAVSTGKSLCSMEYGLAQVHLSFDQLFSYKRKDVSEAAKRFGLRLVCLEDFSMEYLGAVREAIKRKCLEMYKEELVFPEDFYASEAVVAEEIAVL